MDEYKQILKKLTCTPAVSGYEWELGIAQVIQQCIGKPGKKIGENLVYQFGSGKTVLFLSAHMDEVGFFVTNIFSDTATIVPIGDINVKDVVDKYLVFLNSNKKITTKSIRTVNDFSMLRISAKNKLKVGMVGTFSKQFVEKGNKIIATSLDNKVGCLVLIEIIKKLMKAKTDYSIYCCFSACEEVGTNGLLTAVRQINPSICIDVDSAYAKPLDSQTSNWSIPKLGKGLAIQLQGTNFIVASTLRRKLENICLKNDIQYQYEIPSSNSGGTNASSLQNAGYSVAQINIPVRSQHTAKSEASLNDIKSTIQLLETLVFIPSA